MSMSNSIKTRFGLFLLVGLLTPLILTNFGTAKAEDFVADAFKAQWQATDQEVATGAAQHTYFWGPAAFAHTKEVYADAPNGQREVQYFDKARMELNNPAADNLNQVTNGLLTVELITGQMQVGDKSFLQRQPATNPVAGDQLNNPNAPTYASFNQGKLAFGVPGATKATPRKGQAVAERVDSAGNVTTNPGPVSVKYGDYYDQTGHNMSDVFASFFQQAPLGGAKWLAVMGYPISEPYWTKEKINVGGKPHNVLIQLFQRRVLTYTPDNPQAFQVEMGNIGQHYYVWRYGFDPRDQLPGNYRLITPVDTSLLSIKLDGTQTTIGKTSGQITGVYAGGEGRVVVKTDYAVYLADLTTSRFKQLDLPKEVQGDAVFSISQAEGDPSRLAISFVQPKVGDTIVEVFQMGTLASGDNLQVKSMVKAYEQLSGAMDVTFSYSGNYLLIGKQLVYSLTDQKIINIDSSQAEDSTLVKWLGHTDQLIQTVGARVSNGQSIPGIVSLINASTGNSTRLLEDANVYQAFPSPDGNYLGLLFYKDGPQGISNTGSGAIINSRLHFVALANPTTPLTRDYEQDNAAPSDAPVLKGWSADGTYIVLSTSTLELNVLNTNEELSFVSLADGTSIFKTTLTSSHLSVNLLNPVGPFYILHGTHAYDGDGRPTKQTITIQNLDGSNQKILLNLDVPGKEAYGRSPTVTYAQLVEVP